MKADLSKLTIRLTEEQDAAYIKKWLSASNIMQWFPLQDEKEIDDAVRIWISYVKNKSSLTALWDGVPCGAAVLNLQAFGKLAHTCLLTIIVEESKRGLGIGTVLLEELEKLARNEFHLDILHLEVYEDNPAIKLYQRMGFATYGRHEHFTREGDRYRAKIFMQKFLKSIPLEDKEGRLDHGRT